MTAATKKHSKRLAPPSPLLIENRLLRAYNSALLIAMDILRKRNEELEKRIVDKNLLLDREFKFPMPSYPKINPPGPRYEKP